MNAASAASWRAAAEPQDYEEPEPEPWRCARGHFLPHSPQLRAWIPSANYVWEIVVTDAPEMSSHGPPQYRPATPEEQAAHLPGLEYEIYCAGCQAWERLE